MPTYIQKSSTQLQNAPGADATLEKLGNTSELGIVLDQSGSMSSLVNEALAAFNNLLEEQRNLKSAANSSSAFSLALFNSAVRLVYDGVSIAEAKPLTRDLYTPSDGTALNDAIGAMIQAIGKRIRHRTRVLVAILTDGEENSSRKFSIPDIHQMIAYRRTTYDWQFIFIGPPEAEHYALSLGIPKSNITSFSADGAGITAIMARLSLSMRAYQLGDRRYALKLHNS
jgi:uncharacterized protein YegL